MGTTRTATAPEPVLTALQRQGFERDGLLVLPGFVPPSECEALIARARELVEAQALGPQAPKVEEVEGAEKDRRPAVFSTVDQQHTTDDYFLGSGDTVRYFLEAEALQADGSLRPGVDRLQALNKIGHALHDLDPVFARFSRRPELARLVAELGVVAPLLVQSMYIFKQPHIGGEVVYHQDSTFLYTDPPSALGLWLALEDATVENGCMYAVPGAHRRGLGRRFRRTRPDEGTVSRVTFDELDPAVLDLSPADEVPLCAPQGTLIVLHGLLPHRSGANRSPRSRHAYTLHVISGQARYPADNWLQRDPAFPATGF